MKSLVAPALCLAIVGMMVSACDAAESEPMPMSVSTPTSTPGPTPTPTPVPTPSSPATSVQPTPSPIAHDSVLDGFMPPDPVTGVGDIREALLEEHRFQLEVARTPLEQTRGLMERPSLPEDVAMLFVYEQEGYLRFWMKNTLIPLDILFLDAGGVVVDVQTMHTQPGVPEPELKIYRSAQPARYAIEMNAGLAEALGIVPGVQVLFR